MGDIMRYISKMNLVVWIIGVFIAHLLLYLTLGTASWGWTALLATAVWAAVLIVAKVAAGRWLEEQEKVK
ncbi:MAG: hypothetical protein ACM32O_18740 [Clostridia bacterium]